MRSVSDFNCLDSDSSNSHMSSHILRVVNKTIVAFTLLLAVAACSNSSSEDSKIVNWKRGYIVQPIGAAPSVVYLEISNPTDSADTLLGASSPVSDEIEIHEEMMHSTSNGDMPVNMVHMMPVSHITLEAKSSFALSPGGRHIMIHNLKEDLVPGDSVEFTLKFAKAGEVRGKVAVIEYADVDTATTRSNRSR